ncbi:hypothetical protein ROG8370_02696 [Roseovarius gaetbuli]|uniref:Apple domain-containing protein n=1 Tax=Roseovarius gaetbuli TaxID=1356575 RepID=A0A1X6ZRA0_9RHOB|nr:hypothetical protein [Roseovarius gaetbuli]SLN58926.1 hypothetical protein ROG8370_02696 [Roseovarius gaetbuli]
MRSIFVAVIFVLLMSSAVFAMDFDVKVPDGPLDSDSSILIEMRGEIRKGDAKQLRNILADFDHLTLKSMSFTLESPGGNLLEGVALGRVISARQEVTKASVGSQSNPTAICASACVFVYLGADFRHLRDGSRIGVHQFNDPDTSLGGAEAISLTQEISAELLSYIRDQGADPALFERMGRTDIEGIDWVPADILREWRVVTDDILKEVSIYSNVNGKLSLTLKQLSVNGENGISFSCLRDMIFSLAFFSKPDLIDIGSFQLLIDGTAHEISDFRVAKQKEQFTPIGFFVPMHLAGAVADAQSLGARITTPDGDTFFSFEQKIVDEKPLDLVKGCIPAFRNTTSKPTPEDVWQPMTSLPKVDFVGADLTKKGVRGVTFEECQELCTQYVECKAVSYIISKKWCWPKSLPQRKRHSSDVVSATKN